MKNYNLILFYIPFMLKFFVQLQPALVLKRANLTLFRDLQVALLRGKSIRANLFFKTSFFVFASQ